MRKLTSLVITVVFGLACVVGIGHYTQQQARRAENSPESIAESLLTPKELQKRLNELEPGRPLVIDGKIGKLTIEKWERVINNQYAEQIDGWMYE